MNKFAILTFAILAPAAWIIGQSSWGYPADDAADNGAATDDTSPDEGDDSQDAADESDPQVDLPELPPDEEALAIFHEAQSRLYEHSSVRARYREVATFPTRSFVAGGTYLAGGPLQMRLEYQIELGSMRGTLLQVCDGQVSWTRQEVVPILPKGEEPSEDEVFSHTSRRDINQILRAVESEPGVEEAVQVANLGIGGMPAMLAGIESTMIFDHHEARTWDYRTVEMGEEVWKERHCIVVQGRWREQLPETLPQRVHIYFAEDTLFPERFVYLQRVSPDRDIYRPLMDLQFLDVEFDVPVNSDAFTFISPPGTEEHDETRTFIAEIERLRTAAEAAENQAEPSAEPVE
jgi:hypothetical protein